MIGLERLYRIIWPGPGRMKWKRCLILLFTVGALIFTLAIRFQFRDENLAMREYSAASINAGDKGHAMDYEQFSTTRENPSKWMEALDGQEDIGVHENSRSFQINQLVPSSTDSRAETVDFVTEVRSDMLPTTRTSVHIFETAGSITSTFATTDRKNSLQVPAEWKTVRILGFKDANFIKVPDSGLGSLNGASTKVRKHLMVLGHYEQLGKTTVNYILAARLAFLTNRKLTKPFVSDSRFCGLKSGWTGSLRSGTRAFKPLDLYYNITSINEMFNGVSLAKMEYLDSFTESCSFLRSKRKIVIIYFIYPDDYSRKYLMLNSDESEQVKQMLQRSEGWVDCSFLNSRLKIDKRIGEEMKAGRQYCVDTGRISSLEMLENKVLQNDPCVVFHQWRGVGYQRTHFNLSTEVPPENMLKFLKPSEFVITEVMRTLEKIDQNFIGIHIRSERQLLWYGIEKWLKCMNLVYREAKKLMLANSVKVFISADIGRFGSDQLSSNLNSEQLKIVEAKYNWLVEKLDAITYSVIRERHQIWTDRGLVALIQLNILSQASSLITLGAGTFQRWVTDTFKRRREMFGDQAWTITKVCFSELKNWQDMKTSRKTNKRIA